ncbi:MAG: MlaD family protein [Rhodospirillales bacterium]|jgi:phospholipid/cholesterol/gamma-HCH transport system substrate-binding protein
MSKNPAEIALSAVVLLVAFAFLYIFITTAEVGTVQGYGVKAIFTKVGGLQPGSDVKISGVKIGTVTQQVLDPVNYGVVVTLTIKSGIKVPEDTVATIRSEGQFGGKYLRLEPGKSKKSLAAGATIDKTEDYRSLEDQVGKIFFGATGRDHDGGGTK